MRLEVTVTHACPSPFQPDKTCPNDFLHIQLEHLVGADELLEICHTKRVQTVHGLPEIPMKGQGHGEPDLPKEMLSPQGAFQKNNLSSELGEQRAASSKASPPLYSFKNTVAEARRDFTANDAPGYAMSGGGVGGVTSGMGGPPLGVAYKTASSQHYRQGGQGYPAPQTMHRDNAQAMQVPCINPSAEQHQLNAAGQRRGAGGAQIGQPCLARGYQHRIIQTADQLHGAASGRGGRPAANEGQ